MNVYLLAYLLIIAVLLAGYFIVRMPLIRRAYLPTSVGAGLLLLVLGAEVTGTVPEFLYDPFSPLPALLINVVFATLFLGRPLLRLKDMWRIAGPQAAYGQMLAWGYYAIGGIVTLFILIPYFSASPLTAALLEMSFEGGHGTAAGMIPVFNELGFQTGQELTVALATTSLLSALVVGFIMLAWARRRNLVMHMNPVEAVSQKMHAWQIFRDLRLKGIRMRDEVSLARFASQFILVSLAVAGGVGIHQLLVQIENLTWGSGGVEIFGHMPVFTFCMFGGMLAQFVWTRLGLTVSRAVVEIISSAALGVLIATAIGTMSLDFITTDGWVFLILAASGLLWTVGCFVVLGRLMFKRHWFTNAIISFGQSVGTTATGLLFAQMVDPKQKTGAVEGFGYKQLMFEPLMGGGMVTALSMPLILLLGLPIFTTICGVICLAWMIFGILYFGRK